MKRILIHSPYWHIGGGGERYALTAACCLSKDFSVSADFASQENLDRMGKNFELGLNSVKAVGKIADVSKIKSYDGIFWLSDGSIPFLPLFNTKVIHFQAPFKNVDGKSLKNKLKLLGAKVICNSEYTKKFIDKEFGINSKVVYPPVETEKFKPMEKDKLILTVGRFSSSSQFKRHDLLIEAFKELIKSGIKGWRMVIVGKVEDPQSLKIISGLRSQIKGLPIAVKTDLEHERLKLLYGQSSIYWHAAGYGADLNNNPERAEHFGISTVEAMAAGAVPLSFAAGGQLEIIRNGENGFLWSNPRELISLTKKIIDDDKLRERISLSAINRSGNFSQEIFCQEIRKLFNC
ncbi:glycosyltransferase [Candidatus Collierbacteria bacterium]|nr:glycosyltransferase [Candidatus Collierbacteria bacterium]